MKLINLTEHNISIPGWGDPILPSGQVARVTMERSMVTKITSEDGVGSVKVYRSAAREVTGLPAADANTGLIVSTMVRLALPGRIDLFSPAELIRDTSGVVIGARSSDGNA